MIKKLDNIHMNLNTIIGYNKAFNLVVCEREAGKSTQLARLLYSAYKAGKTCLLLRRAIVDITEAYILSLEAILNKFFDEDIKFNFKKGNIKDGIVYVYDKYNKLIFAVVALSAQIARIKSLVLPNIRYIFFDEFILNPLFNEKYLPNEDTKFKEIYNTFYRETEERIKCFWFGNPYSLYNPYFSWLGVDTKKLGRGVLLTGSNWLVWCYEITEELKTYILERNPLYEFDDSYRRYAFEGKAIADEHIIVMSQPNNFSLRFVFNIHSKYVGIFRNEKSGDISYFCKYLDKVAGERSVYCFELNELVAGTCLLSFNDRMKFSSFKTALRKRKVGFSDIGVYYLIEEVYNVL